MSADGELEELRIFGPPGTGKTTRLSGHVRATAEHRGSNRIIVASFTRAAAQEVVSRNLPIPRQNIGTLHSLANRALGSPPVAAAHIEDWNRRYPQWKLSDGRSLDSPSDNVGSDAEGLLEELERHRNHQLPEERWPAQVRAFAHRWESWKSEQGVLDFTDMIEQALHETESAPGDPVVGFFDEQQDLTSLELALVRHWGRRMDRIVVTGDDDQAQAPWTRVRTTDGWVRMDELDPQRHFLVSYNIRSAAIVGTREGFAFRLASHEDGRTAIRVRVGDYETDCTPDHRWWVKVDRSATEKCVVYLMRSGGRFRVGWCQLIRADGNFHLGTRAKLEGADAAWVLEICDARAFASARESVVAAWYGLPTQVWRPVEPGVTADMIEEVYSSLDDVMKRRAEQCLSDYGLLVDHPLWAPGSQGVHGTRVMQVRACNLLNDVHHVPVWMGSRAGSDDVQWLPVRTAESDQIDVAYSISVEPHRSYLVDDGIVTSNCIYGFKGASPTSMLDPPIPDEHKYVLTQSYRVPRAVHEVSQNWVLRLSRREPKEYEPRDADGWAGCVPYSMRDVKKVAQEAQQVADEGRSVMVMASCGYMLNGLQSALKGLGIPFSNPWKRGHQPWNPLRATQGTAAAEKVLAYLIIDEREMGELARLWTGKDIQRWTALIKTQGRFVRGSRQLIKDLPDRELSFEEVARLFNDEQELERAVEPDLGWLESALNANAKRTAAYPIRVARRHGAKALMDEPRLFLGTHHSFKGAEADVVLLSPDMSSAGYRAWQRGGEDTDAVIRQFYVAQTRAKEELRVMAPSTPKSLDPTDLAPRRRP